MKTACCLPATTKLLSGHTDETAMKVSSKKKKRNNRKATTAQHKRLQASSTSNERTQPAVTRWLATVFVVFCFSRHGPFARLPTVATTSNYSGRIFSCVFRLGRDPLRFASVRKQAFKFEK